MPISVENLKKAKVELKQRTGNHVVINKKLIAD